MTKRKTLPKAEIDRIEGKYKVVLKFPHSLAFLSRSPEFLAARGRLLEMGYLDWQILQAAMGMIGNFRLHGDVLQSQVGSREEIARSGTRMMAYLRLFLEGADSPLPPGNALTAGDLEKRILLDGLPWLSRRKIDYPKRPIHFDSIRPLLEQHGYFSVDPRPEGFVFPVAPPDGPNNVDSREARSAP